MGVFRVIFYLNGKLSDIYTDAPNAEVAAALVQVQLQREGFTDIVIKSVRKVNGG